MEKKREEREGDVEKRGKGGREKKGGGKKKIAAREGGEGFWI